MCIRDRVQAPQMEVINRCYNLIKKKINHVEYLIGFEGNEFASTGEIEEDILSITSVHPIREDSMKALLNRRNSEWSIVNKLISEGRLVETVYEGKRFYLRNLR